MVVGVCVSVTWAWVAVLESKRVRESGEGEWKREVEGGGGEVVREGEGGGRGNGRLSHERCGP